MGLIFSKATFSFLYLSVASRKASKNTLKIFAETEKLQIESVIQLWWPSGLSD